MEFKRMRGLEKKIELFISFQFSEYSVQGFIHADSRKHSWKQGNKIFWLYYADVSRRQSQVAMLFTAKKKKTACKKKSLV